jgi:RNA polymerase sigma-70 factor (ECF subfamily)
LTEEDCEDIVQNVFKKVWESPVTFREKGKVINWLFGIAVRMANYEIRKRKWRKMLFPEEPLDDKAYKVPSEDKSPLEQIVEKERLQIEEEQVREALKTLGEEHKKVLELKYDKDLSYKAIADRLGVPIGTVKSRISRAKELMLEKLAECLSKK